MNIDPHAEWWTTTDVADYLGTRVSTVSSYHARGTMPPADAKVGRTQLWNPDTIRKWHEGRQRRAKAPPLPPAEQTLSPWARPR